MTTPGVNVNRWKNAAQAAILLDKDTRNLSNDRHAIEYRKSNGWSKENEKYLQQLGEEAIGYRWIYYTSNNWYNKCDKTLGIVSIGFSAIAGTATFGTLVDCSSTWWLVIINGVVMFMVAFCAGMQNLMKYSEMARDFAASSKVYADLNRNIQYDLNLKRRDRGPAKDIIEKHLSTYLALNASSPTPPSWALQSFKKRFSDSGIYAPMDMQKVIIAEESPANKFNSTGSTPDPPSAKLEDNNVASNFFGKILGVRTGGNGTPRAANVPLATSILADSQDPQSQPISQQTPPPQTPQKSQSQTPQQPQKQQKDVSVAGNILPVAIRQTQPNQNQLRYTQKLKGLRECTPVIALKDDSTSDDDSSDDEYNTYTPSTPVIDTHSEYQQERLLNSSGYTGSVVLDSSVEDAVFPTCDT